MLSASANKLSRLKEQAEEYAALIMEELDPERLGYIEVGHSVYSWFLWFSYYSTITCFYFSINNSILFSRNLIN